MHLNARGCSKKDSGAGRWCAFATLRRGAAAFGRPGPAGDSGERRLVSGSGVRFVGSSGGGYGGLGWRRHWARRGRYPPSPEAVAGRVGAIKVRLGNTGTGGDGGELPFYREACSQEDAPVVFRPPMLSTTIDAIRAVLRMDVTVSGPERAKILFRLRRGDQERKGVPTREARLLRREVVAERLGCSVRAVDNLAAQGVLRKVTLPGRRRASGFREADIETLVNGAVGDCLCPQGVHLCRI